MDYQRIYDEFIADRRTKEHLLTKDNSELHHVKPRSKGGSNRKDNLVRLSFSDHFFSHRLLARIEGGKLITAFVLMLDRTRYSERRSRFDYATWRAAHREFTSSVFTGKKRSDESKAKQAATLRGYRHKPETIAKMISSRALQESPTPETRKKISLKNTGKRRTPEQKKTLSSSQKRRIENDGGAQLDSLHKGNVGRKHSPEVRLRMKEGRAKGQALKRLLTCPVEGQSDDIKD